jgi:hypothetical protein
VRHGPVEQQRQPGDRAPPAAISGTTSMARAQIWSTTPSASGLGGWSARQPWRAWRIHW